MFCAKCGNKLKEDDRFCSVCGTEVDKGESEIERMVVEMIPEEAIKNTVVKKRRMTVFLKIVSVIIAVLVVVSGTFITLILLEKKEINTESVSKEVDKTVVQKDTMEKILAKAQKVAEEGEYVSALDILRGVEKEYGQEERYQKLFETYYQLYIKETRSDVDKLVKDGKYTDALKKIKQVFDEIGKNKKLEEKYKELEEAYIESAIQQTDQLINEQKYEEAKALLDICKSEVSNTEKIDSYLEIIEEYENETAIRLKYVDITPYIDSDPEKIVELMDMESTEPWQFGSSAASYKTENFWLEWDSNSLAYTDYFVTSAKLSESGNVSIFGIIPGMTVDQVTEIMNSEGYIALGADYSGHSYTYAKNENGRRYLLEATFFENSLNGWYWNNWREGEDLPDHETYTYQG